MMPFLDSWFPYQAWISFLYSLSKFFASSLKWGWSIITRFIIFTHLKQPIYGWLAFAFISKLRIGGVFIDLFFLQVADPSLYVSSGDDDCYFVCYSSDWDFLVSALIVKLPNSAIYSFIISIDNGNHSIAAKPSVVSLQFLNIGFTYPLFSWAPSYWIRRETDIVLCPAHTI